MRVSQCSLLLALNTRHFYCWRRQQICRQVWIYCILIVGVINFTFVRWLSVYGAPPPPPYTDFPIDSRHVAIKRCPNAISIWLPFLDANTRVPWLTRIAATYFPVPSRRRLFTIDVVLHFSSAAKCSTKARRRSYMIDRPLVENQPTRFICVYVYVCVWGGGGGFWQLRFSYRVRVTHAGNQVARKLRFPATKAVTVRSSLLACVLFVCVTCKLSSFVRHF